MVLLNFIKSGLGINREHEAGSKIGTTVRACSVDIFYQLLDSGMGMRSEYRNWGETDFRGERFAIVRSKWRNDTTGARQTGGVRRLIHSATLPEAGADILKYATPLTPH